MITLSASLFLVACGGGGADESSSTKIEKKLPSDPNTDNRKSLPPAEIKNNGKSSKVEAPDEAIPFASFTPIGSIYFGERAKFLIEGGQCTHAAAAATGVRLSLLEQENWSFNIDYKTVSTSNVEYANIMEAVAVFAFSLGKAEIKLASDFENTPNVKVKINFEW